MKSLCSHVSSTSSSNLRSSALRRSASLSLYNSAIHPRIAFRISLRLQNVQGACNGLIFTTDTRIKGEIFRRGAPDYQRRTGANANGATHQHDNSSLHPGNSKPNARLVIQHQAEQSDIIRVVSDSGVYQGARVSLRNREPDGDRACISFAGTKSAKAPRTSP